MYVIDFLNKTAQIKLTFSSITNYQPFCEKLPLEFMSFY